MPLAFDLRGLPRFESLLKRLSNKRERCMHKMTMSTHYSAFRTGYM
jgi:hypothetical protein